MARFFALIALLMLSPLAPGAEGAVDHGCCHDGAGQMHATMGYGDNHPDTPCHSGNDGELPACCAGAAPALAAAPAPMEMAPPQSGERPSHTLSHFSGTHPTPLRRPPRPLA